MRILPAYLGFCLILWSGVSQAAVAMAGAGISSVDNSIAVGRFSSMIDAAEYYSVLGERGWAPIGVGPLFRPGQRHPQVAALRTLLILYGDYPQRATGLEPLDLFDDVLAVALRSFQRRHGLNPDAVLGPDTRRALDVPPQARAYQLLLNHERQLALRKRVPGHYVQVNLPEFRLRLYQNDEAVLELKTIVGRESRSTPTFDSEISSLVVNPAWNVPRSIAYKDILPRWKQDADYLGQHNIRIVTGFGANKVWIDADTAAPELLYKGQDYPRLYQLPGRHNALGQIKFIATNNSAIYLHDTPVKSLFERYQRTLSSGCVRVENPRLLARYLLGTQTLQNPLDELLAGSDTRRIRLHKPVGLYLTYWTAWLDRQQEVQFRKDIYHRDPLRSEAIEPGQLVAENPRSSMDRKAINDRDPQRSGIIEPGPLVAENPRSSMDRKANYHRDPQQSETIEPGQLVAETLEAKHGS